MTRDSLLNDTRNAHERRKPQPENVTDGTVTDCGFWNLSMIVYATPANRDYGAVLSGEQQQYAGVGV